MVAGTYRGTEEIFETDCSYSTQVPLTRAEIIERALTRWEMGRLADLMAFQASY